MSRAAAEWDGTRTHREPLTWQTAQPRYVAYCLAHGALSPEDMMARDRIQWPGGIMCGFILWMKQKWGDWSALAHKSGRPNEVLGERDYADFDDWLIAETVRHRPNGPFWFYETETETTSGPTIVQDDPQGGDPHTVAVIARVHRPEALHRLCALANAGVAFDRPDTSEPA